MKTYLTFLLLLAKFASFAQLHAEAVSSVPVTADVFFGVDTFGWLYYAKDNVLFKSKDAKLLQYQNISLGKIKSVDLLNPMSIVVFYADFNSVVMLDNQLNEVRRINFSDYPDPVTAIAVSNAAQNRLWLYNSATQQLGLFDYLKQTYTTITQPLKGGVRYFESDFNHFQWLDEQGNRFSCDLFGKISSLGKWPLFDRIQFVSDTSALYLKNGDPYYFTLDGNNSQLIDLGKKSLLGFWFGPQNLATFTAGEISNYKLKLP